MDGNLGEPARWHLQRKFYDTSGSEPRLMGTHIFQLSKPSSARHKGKYLLSHTLNQNTGTVIQVTDESRNVPRVPAGTNFNPFHTYRNRGDSQPELWAVTALAHSADGTMLTSHTILNYEEAVEVVNYLSRHESEFEYSYSLIFVRSSNEATDTLRRLSNPPPPPLLSNVVQPRNLTAKGRGTGSTEGHGKHVLSDSRSPHQSVTHYGATSPEGVKHASSSTHQHETLLVDEPFTIDEPFNNDPDSATLDSLSPDNLPPRQRWGKIPGIYTRLRNPKGISGGIVQSVDDNCFAARTVNAFEISDKNPRRNHTADTVDNVQQRGSDGGEE